jgi:hypothetical protein
MASTVVVDGGNPNCLTDHSWPNPKEGRRLIRAFLAIKDAHLRGALVTFLEELSKAQRN